MPFKYETEMYISLLDLMGSPTITSTDDIAWSVPDIKRVYISGRYTTIEWADGEKTTVGCSPDDPYSEYAGFAACVVKRLFGSSGSASNILKERGVICKTKDKK